MTVDSVLYMISKLQVAVECKFPTSTILPDPPAPHLPTPDMLQKRGFRLSSLNPESTPGAPLPFVNLQDLIRAIHSRNLTFSFNAFSRQARIEFLDLLILQD
mmetsp:Transcript_101827/g.172523  ORF Transcript_101827/g.172523 Transcript_101827/m.172523 type:complete len:102 (-) Transcript_101827:114-419(-)